jgi:hydrogenase maturation protease
MSETARTLSGMSEMARTLIVGLGSPHGDDQVGWRVAEALRPHVAHLSGVAVRTAAVPLDLLDWLEGVDSLHICDACCSAQPPGTLHRLTLRGPGGDNEPSGGAIELATLRCGGSHDFGLPAVLELAERLDCLPERVVVHAVSGCRFDPGDDMIEEVARAVPGLVNSILEELPDARDLTRAITAAAG